MTGVPAVPLIRLLLGHSYTLAAKNLGPMADKRGPQNYLPHARAAPNTNEAYSVNPYKTSYGIFSPSDLKPKPPATCFGDITDPRLTSGLTG